MTAEWCASMFRRAVNWREVGHQVAALVAFLLMVASCVLVCYMLAPRDAIDRPSYLPEEP